MSDNKKFKNESQDARRHDQQWAAHPSEKSSSKKSKQDFQNKNNKKK